MSDIGMAPRHTLNLDSYRPGSPAFARRWRVRAAPLMPSTPRARRWWAVAKRPRPTPHIRWRADGPCLSYRPRRQGIQGVPVARRVDEDLSRRHTRGARSELRHSPAAPSGASFPTDSIRPEAVAAAPSYLGDGRIDHVPNFLRRRSQGPEFQESVKKGGSVTSVGRHHRAFRDVRHDDHEDADERQHRYFFQPFQLHQHHCIATDSLPKDGFVEYEMQFWRTFPFEQDLLTTQPQREYLLARVRLVGIDNHQCPGIVLRLQQAGKTVPR
jgi:hypothetical protein